MTQQVDTLFMNALVLTMDESFSQYLPGAVAVQGDSIVAVGHEEELKKNYATRARETIDCRGKILMPGLINAHTHVPMTLLRGLADDLRLDVWLMGYMMPVEREFVSPDFVRLGTLIACAESLGAPVERGQVLFEIAPLDGYRVALQVDERDIAHVAPEQRGQLTIASMPGERFGIRVKSVTPVNTAREGRNYFKVEALLDADAGERLRPGMQGVAKIHVDERKLVWIWTRSFTDWLRLWLWSWLP